MKQIQAAYQVTDEEKDELQLRFTYHPPKEGQKERYQAIRAAGKSLAELILEQVPPSRERSLALTNLEEAIMWANAGIARNEGIGSTETT